MSYEITACDIENYASDTEALGIARQSLYCGDDGSREVLFADYMDDGKIWFVQLNDEDYIYDFGFFDPEDEWEVGDDGYPNGYEVGRTGTNFLEDVADAVNRENNIAEWS